jgi:hypothetical protein
MKNLEMPLDEDIVLVFIDFDDIQFREGQAFPRFPQSAEKQLKKRLKAYKSWFDPKSPQVKNVNSAFFHKDFSGFA